jgi:hypothetical protein
MTASRDDALLLLRKRGTATRKDADSLRAALRAPEVSAMAQTAASARAASQIPKWQRFVSVRF